MKVSNRKNFLIIGICLLVVVSVFPFLLFNNNADKPLITENRDELKSITIQIRDKNGNTEKTVIISDSVYMNSIYDHLSSTNTVIHKGTPPMEGYTLS